MPKAATPAVKTLRRLLVASAALALALALAFPLPSATASDTGTIAGAPATARVSYRVVIDAPSPLRATLEQALDLVRWQGFDDMTEDLLDRLVREAIA